MGSLHDGTIGTAVVRTGVGTRQFRCRRAHSAGTSARHRLVETLQRQAGTSVQSGNRTEQVSDLPDLTPRSILEE